MSLVLPGTQPAPTGPASPWPYQPFNMGPGPSMPWPQTPFTGMRFSYPNPVAGSPLGLSFAHPNPLGGLPAGPSSRFTPGAGTSGTVYEAGPIGSTGPGRGATAASRMASAAAGPMHGPAGPMYGPFGPSAAAGAEAAGGTGLRAWMARNTSSPWLASKLAPGAAGTGRFARFVAGAGGMGNVAALGAPLAANYAAGLIDQTDGKSDDMLRTALSYGGMGVAAGSFIPVIGPAAGGLIGLGLGGIKGFFSGKDSPETQAADKLADRAKELTELMRKSGASGTVTNDAIAMFRQQAAFAESPEQVDALYDQMRSIMPSYIVEQEAIRDQQIDMQRNMRQYNEALADAQQWVQPMLRDQLNRSSQYTDLAVQAMKNEAATIENPALRAMVETQANYLGVDNATMNAYQMQAMSDQYLNARAQQMAQQAALGMTPQMGNMPAAMPTMPSVPGMVSPSAAPASAASSGSMFIPPDASGEEILDIILGTQGPVQGQGGAAARQ